MIWVADMASLFVSLMFYFICLGSGAGFRVCF